MEENYYRPLKAGKISEAGSLIFLVIFCFHFFSFSASSQDNYLQAEWTDNTAFLMPSGKWESGIFQSLRFGINENIELRSNVLLIPVLPNAGVKVLLRSKDGFILASEHSVNCPSVLLNTVSFKGTGGLISPQYKFPVIITVSNSLLASKCLGSSSILTANAGFAFALRGYKPDFQSSIDIPVIYQRMAHYYEGVSVRTGLSFKTAIAKRLLFEESARLFIIMRDRDNLFTENSGALLWVIKGSTRLKGGYLLSWGKYPFGNHLQLWPSVDIIFGSRYKEEN